MLLKRLHDMLIYQGGVQQLKLPIQQSFMAPPLGKHADDHPVHWLSVAAVVREVGVEGAYHMVDFFFDGDHPVQRTLEDLTRLEGEVFNKAVHFKYFRVNGVFFVFLGFVKAGKILDFFAPRSQA